MVDTTPLQDNVFAGKNNTRIASLLGTWSGQMKVEDRALGAHLMAYFVVHFMPSPMRGNGCSLEGCSELDNLACKRVAPDGDDHVFGDETCVPLEGTTLDWSDVVAFIYFGAQVDANWYVEKFHVTQDTGGWTGPYSVIMAQNKTGIVPNVQPTRLRGDEQHPVVDRYSTRYTESPLTPFIRMHPECNLFGEDDFEKYLGGIAVKETVKAQFSDTNGTEADPWAKYLGTCDNGDVHPLLPLFEFEFTEQPQNDGSVQEAVSVKVNYKLLSMPGKDKIMYRLFPRLQKKVNKPGSAFHISGPYCYGNDPKRGWTFDLDYDSREEKSSMVFYHGCIEDLPCTPPAAQLQLSANKGEVVYNHSAKATPLRLGMVLYMSIVVVILSILLIVGGVLHYRLLKKHAAVTEAEREIAEAEREIADGDYYGLEWEADRATAEAATTSDEDDNGAEGEAPKSSLETPLVASEGAGTSKDGLNRDS